MNAAGGTGDTYQTRDLLLRQFDIAWGLTTYHLEGLTTEECLWRPAGEGLHVHQDDAGAWRADWPDRETYDLGPPSIAWTTWHIGFWWTALLDAATAGAGISKDDVVWPGSAGETRAWIVQLQERWRDLLHGCTDQDLASSGMCNWPIPDRPFADIVAWATVELMKNAAEIGLVRFLYAVRSQ